MRRSSGGKGGRCIAVSLCRCIRSEWRVSVGSRSGGARGVRPRGEGEMRQLEKIGLTSPFQTTPHEGCAVLVRFIRVQLAVSSPGSQFTDHPQQSPPLEWPASGPWVPCASAPHLHFASPSRVACMPNLRRFDQQAQLRRSSAIME